MELDQIVLWTVIAAGVATLIRIARLGWADHRGWAVKAVLVLGIAGLSWLRWPQQAGWIAGGAWALGLLLPEALTRLAARRTLQQRYAAAAWYSRLVRLLHPFDGWSVQPEMMLALELEQQGDAERAVAVLAGRRSAAGVSPRMRQLIQAQLCRLAQDWDGLLACTEPVAGGERKIPAQLGPLRLRALGETGRLSEMVAFFRASRRTYNGASLHLCRLFLFGFCGRKTAVETLLRGPLAALEDDTKALWLATAELTAGEVAAGRARLTELARRATGKPAAVAARRRLDSPPERLAAALDDDDRQQLAAAEAELRGDLAYDTRPAAGWRRSPVIIGLVFVNSVVYLWETLAGVDALLRVGAMWPGAILFRGEWWRLVTAAFLHLNLAHVALNMLALVVLGPWVERMLGHGPTLLVYLGTGIGAMAVPLFLIWAGVMPDEILVGASGAVFGLIGAQIVLLAEGWRRWRSRMALARLSGLGIVLLAELVFDLATPQVSLTGHAAGLVIGLALTALLAAAGIGRPAERR
jgi:rhomboid protease GluP